jgi:cation diffusion facilitator family transporter
VVAGEEDFATRDGRRAMRLSLAVGVLMLVGKAAAWWFTGSAAILADASESVIHVVAVGFAAFSFRISQRPPDGRFLFGYEKIAFFSAGFEGGMIVVAALLIIAESVRKWMAGLELAHLGAGTLAVLAASLANLALGWHLVREGRRTGSIILEANGRHVLTDSWTSFGVVAGLCLVLATGWKPFDPICAIAAALNILWSGAGLVRRAAGGLLDYADPAVGHELRGRLDEICGDLGVQYHGVRFRHSGRQVLVQVHLLFPYSTPVGEAHRLATLVEDRLRASVGGPVEVETHLESIEDHGAAHHSAHYTGRPE